MQTHRHAMGANLSPFARLATGAEILNINLALDRHGSAKGNAVRLHHPAQQRRRPIGTEHLALRQVGARQFHDVPTGGLHEQGLCEFNCHSNQYAGGMQQPFKDAKRVGETADGR